MRAAILWAPGEGRMHGFVGGAKELKAALASRFEVGLYWPGERLVRLPRRVTRRDPDLVRRAWFSDRACKAILSALTLPPRGDHDERRTHPQDP